MCCKFATYFRPFVVNLQQQVVKRAPALQSLCLQKCSLSCILKIDIIFSLVYALTKQEAGRDGS
jgi:hypothetical protein